MFYRLYNQFPVRYARKAAVGQIIGTHRNVHPIEPVQGLMSMLSLCPADGGHWPFPSDHSETLVELLYRMIPLETLVGTIPVRRDRFVTQREDHEIHKTAPWRLVERALYIAGGKQIVSLFDAEEPSLLELLIVNDIVLPSLLALLNQYTVFSAKRPDKHTIFLNEVKVSGERGYIEQCGGCTRVYGITQAQVKAGIDTVIFYSGDY